MRSMQRPGKTRTLCWPVRVCKTFIVVAGQTGRQWRVRDAALRLSRITNQILYEDEEVPRSNHRYADDIGRLHVDLFLRGFEQRDSTASPDKLLPAGPAPDL